MERPGLPHGRSRIARRMPAPPLPEEPEAALTDPRTVGPAGTPVLPGVVSDPPDVARPRRTAGRPRLLGRACDGTDRQGPQRTRRRHERVPALGLPQGHPPLRL